jgi:hypothetical protein
MALDITGIRSNSNRGRTSIFVDAIKAISGASNLWVQMTAPRQWAFLLGVNDGSGNVACDWTVTLGIDGGTVTVSTGKYLTSDDVLVNGDQHDALRGELLRALALGERQHPEVERAVSEESLTASHSFAAVIDPVTIDFQFATNLDPPAAWKHLERLGHRMLDRDEDRGTWALGLPSCDDADRVTLLVSAGGISGHACIESDGGLSRRVAQAGLLSFIGRALFVLRRDDPDVRYIGPSEWGGGRAS